MNHSEQVIYVDNDGLKQRNQRAGAQREKSATTASAPAPRLSGDLKQKVKGLVQLAREKGFLTREDIQQAINGAADDQEQVFRRLRDLEIEIVDETEGLPPERPPVAQPERAIATPARLDELDDPLRLYLKQMALVPLLTSEQEIEISKRIQNFEEQIRAH